MSGLPFPPAARIPDSAAYSSRSLIGSRPKHGGLRRGVDLSELQPERMRGVRVVLPDRHPLGSRGVFGRGGRSASSRTSARRT